MLPNHEVVYLSFCLARIHAPVTLLRQFKAINHPFRSIQITTQVRSSYNSLDRSCHYVLAHRTSVSRIRPQKPIPPQRLAYDE